MTSQMASPVAYIQTPGRDLEIERRGGGSFCDCGAKRYNNHTERLKPMYQHARIMSSRRILLVGEWGYQ